MAARILLADDHAVVREGLREMLGRCPDMAVVAEAADGFEAIRLGIESAPDLILLDVSLPGRNGLEVLKSLRTAGSTAPVLFFSMHPAAQYADYARRAGAQGFLTKDASSATLVAALRRLLVGGSCFPPSVRRRPTDENPFAALSQRETEVMRALVRGEAAAAIADRMGISAKTVATYRRRLLEKLGVGSNAELAVLAARYGVV